MNVKLVESRMDEMGIGTRELGALCVPPLTRAHIWALLRGKRRLTDDVARRLAKVLRVRADLLRNGDKEA